MKKLPSLNGLRAISITIVILFHLVRFSFNVDPEVFYRIPIFDGRFGVNIFFVISGFLITSLLLQEEAHSGKISLKQFYIRRTLRIFPAYFFLLFVYWILQLLGLIHIPRISWLTSLTYTKYLNYRVDYYTSHTWSLSVEETFYLLWPTIFLLGDKIRKNAVVAIIFIVPIVRSYIYFNPVSWINEQSLFTRLDAIALGCYFAIHQKEILRKCSAHWNEIFYSSLLLLFLLPWVELWLANSDVGLFLVPIGTLHGTLANIAIGFIMMYSIFGPRRIWYKVLNTKIFDYVGILSYSIYLWQQLYVAKRDWWVTHFPQNIICIFLSSIFSYYIIEKPFLKLKSKFSRKKVQAPSVVRKLQFHVLDEKESG